MQQFLAAQRLHVEVGGGAEDRDEQLGLKGHLQRGGIIDGDGEPGKVDEELLAGLVVLAHRDAQVLSPRAIERTELGVGVTTGVLLEVFEPEQIERDPLLREFALHVVEVGLGTDRLLGHRAKEPSL